MHSQIISVGVAALLIAPLFAGPGAAEDPGPLGVSPFVVGSVATFNVTTSSGSSYTQPWTVEAVRDVLAVTGDMVPAFVLRKDVDESRYRWEAISNRTMTIENTGGTCSMRSNGECSPFYSLDWTHQGIPGVYGATALQGRSFAVGDSWSVDGTCVKCAGPTTVRIEAPGPDSPVGTDFVANITSPPSYAAFFLQAARLHMTGTTPFPLLAEVESVVHSFSFTASLVTYSLGDGEAIVPPSPPTAASYEAPLTAVPYEHNRPVEGTPLPGYPSWAEAREATGPDPGDRYADATFISIQYPVSTGYLRVRLGDTDIYREDSFTFSTRYAVPGDKDHVTEYRHTTHEVAGETVDPGLAAQWRKSESNATASDGTNCAEVSVPLWALVRAAQDTDLLGEFNGFFIDRRGFSFPDCRREADEMYVLGDVWPPPTGGFGFGTLETMTLDIQTGYLEHAFLLPH